MLVNKILVENCGTKLKWKTGCGPSGSISISSQADIDEGISHLEKMFPEADVSFEEAIAA